MAIRLIGTAPNQVPTNADLSDLAFMSSDAVNIGGGSAVLQSLTVTDFSQFNVEATPKPAAAPTLSVDFINGQAVDTRVSFSRASTATRVNARGYIESVDYDIPRIDYDPYTKECKGLLLEDAMTNAILYSQDFSNALWVATNTTKDYITTGSLVKPDGGVSNIYRITETATTAEHYVDQSVSFTSGKMYTFSVYVSAAGRDLIEIRLPAAAFTAVQSVMHNVSNILAPSTVTAGNPSYTREYIGNGWYRLSISATATATATGNISMVLASGNLTSYLGVVNTGLYVWGAQLEEDTATVGPVPSSYIPTTSAIITRARDIASISGTNFTNMYNRTTGTVYFEGMLTSAHKDSPILSINNGSSTDYNCYLSYTLSGAAVKTETAISNVSSPITVGTTTRGSVFKLVNAYTNEDGSAVTTYRFYSTKDGVPPVYSATNTNTQQATYTGVSFGITPAGTNKTSSMYVRKFAYFAKQLSASEQLAITRI